MRAVESGCTLLEKWLKLVQDAEDESSSAPQHVFSPVVSPFDGYRWEGMYLHLQVRRVRPPRDDMSPEKHFVRAELTSLLWEFRSLKGAVSDRIFKYLNAHRLAPDDGWCHDPMLVLVREVLESGKRWVPTLVRLVPPNDGDEREIDSGQPVGVDAGLEYLVIPFSLDGELHLVRCFLTEFASLPADGYQVPREVVEGRPETEEGIPDEATDIEQLIFRDVELIDVKREKPFVLAEFFAEGPRFLSIEGVPEGCLEVLDVEIGSAELRTGAGEWVITHEA